MISPAERTKEIDPIWDKADRDPDAAWREMGSFSLSWSKRTGSKAAGHLKKSSGNSKRTAFRSDHNNVN
jgi:hypothetical protein